MTAARVTTEVEAANLALALLREPELATLDDDNPRGRQCRKWFGTARDAALRYKFWNFAKAWATPAAATPESGGPLKKQYPLPADCVMVRHVEGLGTDEWEVASAVTVEAQPAVAVLLTNATAPNICYTRRVTDFSLWDAPAVMAFAKLLAGLMAPAFGKSFSEAAGREDEGREEAQRAARTDAREQAPMRRNMNTSWLSARRGFRFR